MAFRVSICDDSDIYLVDDDKADDEPHDEDSEIVMWTEDEWRDDPSIVVSIVNAVRIGFQEGPSALRDLLSA